MLARSTHSAHLLPEQNILKYLGISRNIYEYLSMLRNVKEYMNIKGYLDLSLKNIRNVKNISREPGRNREI
jgi:hypothetical protein